MFGRLKTFVLGGAAGSPGTPQTNDKANNTAGLSSQPGDRWMRRTKRKRDTSNIDGDNVKDPQIDGSAHATSNYDNHDGEPLTKKSRVDTVDATILTPVFDAVPRTPKNSESRVTSGRKRRGSYGSTTEDTPSKRMRKDWADPIARPTVDDGMDEFGEPDELTAEARDDGPLLDLADDQSAGVDDDAATVSTTEDTFGGEVDVVASSLAKGLAILVRQYGTTAANTPVRSVSGTTCQPSKHLRRQAKKQLALTRADRKAHNVKGLHGEEKVLLGIGSWTELTAIPGSLLRGSVEADGKIELPRGKPSRERWGRQLLNKKLSKAERRRLMEAAD